MTLLSYESTMKKKWQEEAGLLLTLLDCTLLGEKAVYASSEFTTGKRFYELCLRYNVKTNVDLKMVLSSRYYPELLNPNIKKSIIFAKKVRSFGRKLVITPNSFINNKWSQPKYLAFWEKVIKERCHSIFFNKGWEYSNGCTFEYLIGSQVGMPLFDHENKRLDKKYAEGLIRQAIKDLIKKGFKPPKLLQVYDGLISL